MREDVSMFKQADRKPTLSLSLSLSLSDGYDRLGVPLDDIITDGDIFIWAVCK